MAIKNIFKKKQWKADYEAGRDAFNAGQFKAAETHLRSAMGKAIELDDSAYGDTALLLGQVARRLERYDESLELTEKAFTYFSGFFGSVDQRTVAAHLSLVLADAKKAHSDPALRQATYEKAVEQFGAKTWQVVRTAALALAHLSGTEREKALGQAQDALAYALGEGRQELGAWPPVAEEFALELSRLGYTDLAARFMASQLRVHEERFGDKSEEAALTRLTLGEFFLQCGEWAKAETALAKALEQIKLKHGPKSELARRGTICLGQALARQGRLEQAAPYLTEALEKLRGDQGTERLEALVWLLEYKCMIAASDAERGALWRELEMAWESNTSDAARSRIYRGFSDAQRRLQEGWELGAAERFLQAVLNRVRHWRGPHHPDVAACMMDLGLCAALREDDAKALSYAEQSLALDEGVDNLIRSVHLYGELGEFDRANQSARMAQRLLKAAPLGTERGRRQAVFAANLLKAGDVAIALEQAALALEQLPESEQDQVRLIQAEAYVLGGQWREAEKLYQQSLHRVTEPVARAKAYLHYAWLLCQVGRFAEMSDALNEVQALSSLRREHPIIIAAKAVASQGAFYSGNIYQGKEERDAVFAFLRQGQHQQTRRALSILTLLDPFGPDEYGTELDVGTQILAAARYPEAICAVYPSKDAACIGLRHLTRALFFHGQEALAQERLSQYRERFIEAYGGLDNPLASSLHLCAAALASDPSAKVEALEAARRGLKELGARHVNLFPTLSLLAEQYIEVGSVEQAKATISEAMEIRKSGRLKEWMATLQKGELPSLGTEPSVPRAAGASAAAESNSYETVTAPPQPDAAASTEPPLGTFEEELAAMGLEPDDTGETMSTPSSSTPDPIPAYVEAPRTEDETPASPVRVPLPVGVEKINIEDSGTVVAYGGPAEVARIPLAVTLAERDLPPTGEEVEAFLEEVKARFGNDTRARQDALFLLALLFPDGSNLALKLWNQALNDVFSQDFETLLQLENRARDANASSLVLATLHRRLSDEVGRYGEQATESIDTLTRMARAYEARGELDQAYQRVILTTEILRSWFGARSRRLLDPLSHLIRICEKQDNVAAALEHHLERHHLLESGQTSPEELFSSRVALLPIRALLGQVTELMEEATAAQAELSSLGPVAVLEFGAALLPSALRLERLHWRVQEAARLLEMAMATVPDSETSLSCRLQVAFAECQARREYRAQAQTLRKRTLERVSSLSSQARAEILHEMAESCLRVRELTAAREIAEVVLEERIADGGRKDQWAGRSLLVLAEADLRSYRLEGTETAIAMSRPSLEGSSYWTRAQILKSQSDFFLGREEEAYATIDSLSPADALELQLPLAVWRGQAEALCQEMESETPSPLQKRWSNLESVALDDAVSLLEFLARAGRVRQLKEGLSRLEPRLANLLTTDIRTSRTNILKAILLLWEGSWAAAEELLQRALDIMPAGGVEMPDGLSTLVVRGHLVACLLAQDKIKQAESQARAGTAEAAELLGEEDIRSLAFRSHSAYCAEARGDLEESMVILDEILVPLQDRLGDTHVLLRDIYRGLSRAFRDDVESARLTAEEALRIDKECRGLSIHLVEDLQLLSKVERNEDRSEAVNLLDTAIELAGQVLPPGHSYRTVLTEDRSSLESEPGLDEALEEEEAPEVQAALLPAQEEEEEEYEASLDGWEVVEEDEEPDSWVVEEEAESREVAEEPEPAQQDSREDFVEDSMFEAPLVELRAPAQEPEELELSEEERAEEAAAELELSEEERAEEAAAELELSEEERAEEAAAEPQLSEEERAEEAAAEPELSEEERAEEAAAELQLSEEERAEEAAAEPELSEEERAEEAAAESELSEEERAEEAAAEPELSEEERAEEAAAEPELSEEERAEEAAAEPELSEEVAVEAEPEEESAEEDAVVEAEPREEQFEEAAAVEVEPEEEQAEEAAAADTELSEEESAEEAAAVEAESEEESAEESAALEDETQASGDEEAVGPPDEALEAASLESLEPDNRRDSSPETESAQTEPEASPEVPTSGPVSPTSYKTVSAYYAGPRSTSYSVEPSPDFPPVPFRLPALSELVEPAQKTPELVAIDEQPVEQATEPELEEEFSSAEIPSEVSAETAASASFSISLESMAEQADPEACLLPLAPVFFLPVPWKEATEAAFDEDYELLHERFQEQFAIDGDWREVVDEAVSTVRLDPTPAAGYFLFLIGAQLEKGGRLHTADLCLATAIELLETGPSFGCACHLAGRVAGRRGELRRALDYFDRAAELADEPELAVLKVDAAECHLGLGRPEEALIGFEEVVDYLNEEVPKVQALAVQAKMAQIHLLIGDPDSSQALAEDVLSKLSPKNEGTYRVLGRILLSRAFARLGRHELALELAEQAWTGAGSWSTKRREGRRIAISNLVDIYSLTGRHEKAEEMIRESGLLGWGLAESELLLRAGHVACTLGKHDAARSYLRLGQSFLARFRSPALWRSSFLELEAELALQKGNAAKADELSRKALALFEQEATGPVDRSRHLVRAARIAGALGQVARARALVEEAHGLRDLHLGATHPHTESVEGLAAVLRAGESAEG